MDTSDGPSTTEKCREVTFQITETTGNNVFSRANIFGIFLALSFCLLTQPHGSLLYMRPSRIPGRIIFFFWRLNPLACLVEAMVILYILVDGSRARWHHKPDDRNVPKTFKKRLQTAAAAALFLRRYTYLPEYWAILADKLYWESNRADETRPPTAAVMTATEPTTVAPVIDPSADIVDEQRLGYEGEAPRRESPPPPYSQNEQATQQPPRRAPARSSTSTNTPPILVRRNSQPEDDLRLILEAELSKAIRSFKSGHPSVGRHTFTSAEGFIRIVSVISVLVVIVKIAATDIPSYIHIATWFMIGGWLTLELLVTIAHWQVEDGDVATEADLLHYGFLFQSRLQNKSFWKVLYVVCLPVFLYMGHIAFYETEALFRCTGWRPFIRSMTINVFLIGVFWYKIIVDIRAGLRALRRLRDSPRVAVAPESKEVDPPSLKTLLQLGFGFLGITVVAFAGGYGLQKLEKVIDRCSDKPDGKVCEVLLTSSTALWLSVWFFAPLAVFSSLEVVGKLRQKTPGCFQVTSLLWSMLVTTMFFVTAMVLYNAEATYKPDWLDWLGKMHRSVPDVDNMDVAISR